VHVIRLAARVNVRGRGTCILAAVHDNQMLNTFKQKLTRLSSDNERTSSAVAEMGDRLATIDMGYKVGGCAPLGKLDDHLTQCGLGRGLSPCQVSS